MNCSFCAVQKLEPIYENYICIKNQIDNVIKQCGEKRNLMLMDNNVLKSPMLDKIVQDIVDLGFAKGAKCKSKKSPKMVKRHVDFNQGLDANFLTEEKAKLLARLELDPVRIAFDHIQQKEKYLKAINTCFNAGLYSFSNYLLYNTNDASWKGHSYGADTPEDLYNRLRINVDLCEQMNLQLKSMNSSKKVYIYSFPMRFIPLTDMKRGYIGDNWNKKALRAIQVFITPTQGKGVSSKTFFEASFGKNLKEYKVALYTPENILIRRGGLKFTKSELSDPLKKQKKTEKHNFNKSLVNEWNNMVKALQEQNIWDSFVNTYIKNNIFTFDVYLTITTDIERMAFLYYITYKHYKKHANGLPKEVQLFIKNFLTHKAPFLNQYFSEMIRKAN